MIPKVRTLTRKSVIGIGQPWSIKDMTVEKVLGMIWHVKLVSLYYKISSINFTDDVLNELRITPDLRIPKPGTNKTLYYICLLKYPPKFRGDERAKKMKAKTKPFKKSFLQGKNHGR